MSARPSRKPRLFTALTALAGLLASVATVSLGSSASAASAGGQDPNARHQAPWPGSPQTPQGRININGRNVFLNGINMPWAGVDNFGQDFGCRYNPDNTETMFHNLQAYGANAVRAWVHIDGRCSPTFDKDNKVTGISAQALGDLHDFLTRAKNHNVAVLLTLWSVELEENSGAWVDAHGADRYKFIADPAKTQTYIDNALIPLANSLNSEPALLGYEVANEMDFGVDSRAVWGDSPAPATRIVQPLAVVQRFIAQQVVALHKNTTKYVTGVGSASFKWLADKHPGDTVGNWWDDAALRQVTPRSDERFAYNDFLQTHWYDWEKGPKGSGGTYSFDPWEDKSGPSFYNAGNKPVVIGENPITDDKFYTPQEKLAKTYEYGYFGNFFWSYYGIDHFGGWDKVKDVVKAFRDAHPADVDLNLNGGSGPTPNADPPVLNDKSRTGTHLATLVGTGSYRNLHQFVNGLQPNTTYTAQIFTKGTQATEFHIHAGVYGADLGITTCANSINWRACTITFNTGANTQVTFRLTDNKAGNTSYFDDASLTTGTTDVLVNGGFENGDTAWGVEAPFAIH